MTGIYIFDTTSVIVTQYWSVTNRRSGG